MRRHAVMCMAYDRVRVSESEGRKAVGSRLGNVSVYGQQSTGDVERRAREGDHHIYRIRTPITREHISLPSPAAYSFARRPLCPLVNFAAGGLVATSFWVLAHESGKHQAFSESKFMNDLVHSASVQFPFCL
jgi:hypothetical protein